jgi:hypothetical protein
MEIGKAKAHSKVEDKLGGNRNYNWLKLASNNQRSKSRTRLVRTQKTVTTDITTRKQKKTVQN